MDSISWSCWRICERYIQNCFEKATATGYLNCCEIAYEITATSYLSAWSTVSSKEEVTKLDASAEKL